MPDTQESVQLYLAPDHRLDLKKSGLTAATITAAGIAAIPPEDIDKAIGYKIPEVISAYRIPFGNGYERIKVFYHADAKPAPGKKLRKYHQKAGSGNRLYIPATLDASALNDIKKTIYITEGEKKTLKAVQEGLICIGITGLWNWKRKGTDELISDFSRIQLENRKVVLVPDSDYLDASKNLSQAVERLARALQLAGASVYVLNFPEAGDEKVGLDDYLVKHGIEKFHQLPQTLLPLESCCRVERGRLKFYEVESVPMTDSTGKKTGDKYDRYKAPVIIADAIEVIAHARNDINQDWGRLLEFKDKEGVVHRWFMSMDMMSRDGEGIRKELLNRGLFIHPMTKYRMAFNIYIQTTEPVVEEFALCTGSTGWQECNCFVLPGQVIGATEYPVVYQGSNKSIISCKGSLHDWIQTIGMACVGNSRLVFAAALSFAAPLLYICGKENGGFNLQGKSTSGKSTALFVAASIWGSPHYVMGWQGTIVGHECKAAEHNDLVTLIDEISEADPKTLGNIVYMFSNGQGKSRGNVNIEARQNKRWRTLLLSTGEVGLADIMNSDGKKTKAGQEIRLCGIPADTCRYGAFDDIHSYEDGDSFAKHLKKSANNNYGYAGVAFIQHVIEHRESIPETVREVEAQFKSLLPKNSDGQVIRVANRFALIAAAGELATDYGLTGWSAGEAIKASIICLKDWIATRGGVIPHETRETLGQIKRFFENHGSSRFTDCDYPEQTTHNRVGFRKRIIDAEGGASFEYYVFTETFRQEICAGLNAVSAAKLLIERGILKPGAASTTSNVRIPGYGQKRCYIITSKVLEVE